MAKQNRADETSPWAIIRVRAPFNPHKDSENIPEATMLMWPTEEYAINAFRSVCRRHIILVTRAPHMQNTIRGADTVVDEGVENIVIMRSRPYPPNLSSIAAKIIDPAMGASTWAFGSHRWNP